MESLDLVAVDGCFSICAGELGQEVLLVLGGSGFLNTIEVQVC